MNLSELSNQELFEMYIYYAKERLPMGASVVRISHGSLKTEIVCTYKDKNKLYIKNIHIPERLRR